MTTNPILQGLLETINASEENDVDKVLKMMNPTSDKEEMTEIYKDVIGYDPVEYHNTQTIKDMILDISSSAPSEVRSIILDRKEEILNEMTSEEFKDDVEVYVIEKLDTIIFDLTGWSSINDEGFEVDNFNDDNESNDDEDDCYDDESHDLVIDD